MARQIINIGNLKFPTGCNKFQVKIEGTANVGTVKIDLAVR